MSDIKVGDRVNTPAGRGVVNELDTGVHGDPMTLVTMHSLPWLAQRPQELWFYTRELRKLDGIETRECICCGNQFEVHANAPPWRGCPDCRTSPVGMIVTS